LKQNPCASPGGGFYLFEQLISDNTTEGAQSAIFSGSFAANENILSIRKTLLTQLRDNHVTPAERE